MILTQKIIKIPKFLWHLPEKLKKFLNCTWFLPPKCPNFLHNNCPKSIFSQFFFWGGGGGARALPTPSPMPMAYGSTQSAWSKGWQPTGAVHQTNRFNLLLLLLSLWLLCESVAEAGKVMIVGVLLWWICCMLAASVSAGSYLYLICNISCSHLELTIPHSWLAQYWSHVFAGRAAWNLLLTTVIDCD